MTPSPGVPRSGAANMPPYVERGGEVVYAQPHAAIGMRMYCFVIDVDRAAVDRKAERELNAPTGGAEQFVGAAPAALLNFVTISRITPSEPPESWLGYLPENECSLWVPLFDRKRKQLLWSVPYMFVDSGPAMSGGREIFGFPKQYGWSEVPRGDTAPDRLGLETVALAKIGPDEMAQRRTLVTASRKGPAFPLTSVKNNAALLVDQLFGRPAFADLQARGRDRVLADLRAIASPTAMSSASEVAALFLGQILAMHLPMVLLKQFRDVVEPWRSCYLGVVEVTNEIDVFRHGGLLPDDYTVEIADLAGEPIRRELGIGPNPITPSAAFWLEFDFVVGSGRVLWDSLGRQA